MARNIPDDVALANLAKNFLHMNISWITVLKIKAEIKENIEDSSLI